jgi:hypothetical protein
MNGSLKQIVKEAFDITCEDFVRLVDDAMQLTRSGTNKMANIQILGKLVMFEATGKGIICGDLHGDLESLVDILKDSDALAEMGKHPNIYLIFLGDYGDRGPFSVEVYWVVLKLKTLFPDQVILLRGNHEGPENLLPIPYDLPTNLQKRFGDQWHLAHGRLRRLFESLHVAIVVEGRYLMLHGGLATGVSGIADLAFENGYKKRGKAILEELLWNDPNEGSDEVVDSPRGAGKLFSKKLTRETLKMLGVHILVRGHEPCEEGFKISHDGQILTLFSRKGPPYFNGHAAYLDLPFDLELKDANQLVPYIHRF